MAHTRHDHLIKFIFIVASLLFISVPGAYAQELVTNGNFNNSGTGWTTACTSVEASYYETTYGGTVSTNHVAEVDDESCFYQDVCVLPGMSYIFSMNASRRNGSTPNPLTSHIKIEGLSTTNTVLATYVNMDYVRTNTSFAFTPVTGIPVFNVPISSGVVRLRITLTDNTSGYSTLGMIVDDISLTFATPPAVTGADTLCQNSAGTLGISNLPASGIFYNWNFGTGATPATSTVATPSVSWSTTGTKPVVCLLSNGSCTADTVRKNVFITTNPLPPVVTSPIKYCTGDIATQLTATGTNLQWYTSATGGTPTAVAPTPSTATAGNTTYYVSQQTGSCESGRSAIVVQVYDGAHAAFSYNIRYGCTQDTVDFTNLSTGGGLYEWDFGDGSGAVTQNATHIYTTRSIFNVRLKNSGNYCKDSVTHAVDLNHPLQASFSQDKDTICQNQAVQFFNSSTATTHNGINPAYHWDFGDGSTDTAANPSHTYTTTGVFIVKMVVKDFVPCTDTATHIIYVDTLTYAQFTTSDSVICAGRKIDLDATYQHIGNTSLAWDFGDGSQVSGHAQGQHAYETPGSFTITFTAGYRICPNVTIQKTVRVKPQPIVNLGADTTMCPYAAPLVITDMANAGNAAAQWQWNTGAATPAISVNHPGLYAVTVTIDGCTGADSVEIFKDCYIDIPNSFTPNDDGLNDYFFPRQLLSHAVNHFTMQVFNRWGQIIFETTSINGRGWDGRFNNAPQPQGAYVYLIDVVFTNGVKEHYEGNVTLLR